MNLKTKITSIYGKHRLLTQAVLLYVISRIVMFGLYVVLFKDFSFSGFVKEMNHYDSNHYRRIVNDGYLAAPYNMTGEAGWAFFPFYPLLVGVICKITGATSYIIAFLLGSIFMVGSLVYGAEYIKLSSNSDSAASFYILLMTGGCYSFYCSAFYTEAPFLFLLSACLYYLEKKSYIKMGVLGALMCMTRSVGVFFEFVIVLRLLQEYWSWDKQERGDFKSYFGGLLKNPSLILGISILPAGFFGFMYYLYKKVGDGLAFVHVQVAWGRTNTLFIKHFFNGLKSLTGYDAYCSMWAVAGFFFIWLMIVKYKRFHEAFWGLVIMILPMCSAMDSVPRYMFGGLVFYRCFADEIAGMKWYYKLFTCGFFCFYELLLINGWLLGYGVLI